MTRKLALRGHAEDAVKLARQPRLTARAGAEAAPNEPQEALAVVGIELFRAGQKETAAKLADQAAAVNGGAKTDKEPPLGPMVVALCVATGKPEPKPGKAPEDADALTIGRPLGLGLKGDAPAARGQQIASPEARFTALVLLAAVTRDLADVDPAAALLEGELNKQAVSPWLVLELAEVAARVMPADRVLRLADHANDPGLKARRSSRWCEPAWRRRRIMPATMSWKESPTTRSCRRRPVKPWPVTTAVPTTRARSGRSRAGTTRSAPSASSAPSSASKTAKRNEVSRRR